MNTSTQIKKSNYHAIYQLFYQETVLSKQDIVNQLSLSLPTVSNNLEKLESEGMIVKDGLFDSDGGRPAVRYSLVKEARVSLGLEIKARLIRLTALNLVGESIESTEIPLTYEDSLQYYKRVTKEVIQFIETIKVPKEQLLGLGISLQALIDTDHQTITYAQILSYHSLDLNEIIQAIGLPTLLFHDVACAANAELWQGMISEGVYLSLSEHLGSALIIKDQIDQSPYGNSGAIEHMQIGLENRLCYCGNMDCMETYCSIDALLEEHEDIDEFFKEVRLNVPSQSQRWHEFITILGRSLSNLYLILARPIILGGELASYINQEDLNKLSKIIKSNVPFEITHEVVTVATVQNNATLTGAALHFIEEFLHE